MLHIKCSMAYGGNTCAVLLSAVFVGKLSRNVSNSGFISFNSRVYLWDDCWKTWNDCGDPWDPNDFNPQAQVPTGAQVPSPKHQHEDKIKSLKCGSWIYIQAYFSEVNLLVLLD